MRKTLTAALLTSAVLSTPAAAQGDTQRYLSGLAGRADFFWAKGVNYSGDVLPIRAPITSIQWEGDCDMVIRFGKATEGWAPYQSPVFIKWGSIVTVDIAKNFFIFRHNYAGFMPGYRWGFWVPDNEQPRMKQAMQSMIDSCDG
ncbi:MAG: hypothetical protein ACAH11_04405 [Sphingomonas sp.]